MTKYLIVILLLFLSHNSIGQVKEMYLNDDLEEITKAQFRQVSTEYINPLIYDLDTITVYVKVKVVRKGKLSETKTNLIRNWLSSLSGKDIPENHILVLNYFHGKDLCISAQPPEKLAEENRNYLKELESFENVSQFFLYKSPEVTEEYDASLNWLHDETGVLEKMFLPLHYPCGSYVLIDDTGNYYVHKGNHRLARIHELLKNKASTFNGENDKKGEDIKLNTRVDSEYMKSRKTFKGRLDNTEYTAMKAKLEKELNTKIPEGKSIFISYNQRAPNCVSLNSSVPARTERRIQISANISAETNAVDFFVFAEDAFYKDFYHQLEQFQVDSGFFRNTIFTLRESCQAFYILRSDGSFMISYGEDNYSEASRFLKKRKKRKN